MNFTIKTNILQSLVNKAIKASTNNKMIPLTGLMSIALVDGTLNITTCDGLNFFTVSAKDVTGENFEVVIRVDTFSKIVAKTTSEYITLTLDGTALTYKGNGTYKIDLPLGPEGELITFPVNEFNFTEFESGTINLPYVKSVIVSNKPCLATTSEYPCLTCYYCGDGGVIAGTRTNICYNEVDTFETPALLTPMIFDLLSLFDSDEISYKYAENVIEFTSNNMRLFAKTMPYIDDYSNDKMKELAQLNFVSECVVSKSQLINVLDRLALFVDDFNINAVNLNFTKEGLQIVSMNDAGSEIIPYQESTGFAEYSCCMDIALFKKNINARSGELVRIQYGLCNMLVSEENEPEVYEKQDMGCIKLVDNAVTHIIAFMDNGD